MSAGTLASWKAQRAQKQAAWKAAKRAKACSDEIDLQIQEDSKRRKCDILLMGSSALSIPFYIRPWELLYRVERSSLGSSAIPTRASVYGYADVILALGHNERDISILVRQMKIIHQDGYTHEERIEFRPTIWKNLLETSRSVVQVLRMLDAKLATLASKVRRFRITISFVT